MAFLFFFRVISEYDVHVILKKKSRQQIITGFKIKEGGMSYTKKFITRKN